MSALSSPGLDSHAEELAGLRSARISAEKRYLMRAKSDAKPQPAQWQSYWHLKQKEQ